VKQVDIVIPHERLDEVNKILYSHKVGGLMFYDIKGRGRAKPEPVPETVRAYRTGRTYVPEFGTRTKIEVLIPDSLAQQIVQNILTSLSTGSAADGKIFVKDVAEAYDIGTKQSGEVAL
jgi:nitrogen regulatory protein P-II 1